MTNKHVLNKAGPELILWMIAAGGGSCWGRTRTATFVKMIDFPAF
jgi:hypothetical protein